MTIGRIPLGGLHCPLCSGRLETWTRAELHVDFCDACSGLFLDRGELFDLFRAEGYQCPPEALLRHTFSPASGESLRCPKCEEQTLTPGTVEGSDMWHCTPCNGFLVDRGLLLGEEKARSLPLDLQGFKLLDGNDTQDNNEGVSDDVGGLLSRLVFWGKGGR
jgi:Zn-finger nucleic acid-binding protein